MDRTASQMGQMLVGGILNFYFSLSSNLETIREMEGKLPRKQGWIPFWFRPLCLPSLIQ